MQCHLYWHNALQLVFNNLCTLRTWISSARYLNSRDQLTTTKEKKKKKKTSRHATGRVIKNYHIHSCWSLAPVHKLNVQVVQSLLQSKFQCNTLQFFLIQLCWFNIIPKMMYKTRSALCVMQWFHVRQRTSKSVPCGDNMQSRLWTVRIYRKREICAQSALGLKPAKNFMNVKMCTARALSVKKRCQAWS